MSCAGDIPASLLPECPDGYCSIPGGQFKMGSPEGTGYPDEHRQKAVTMLPYELMQKEVTVGEFKEFAERAHIDLSNILLGYCGHLNDKGDDFPVVCLKDWEKAAFCADQNTTDQYVAVPTAAQIEFASRGPDGTDEHGTPIDYAVLRDNGFRSTEAVNGPYAWLRCNGFGVCDLAGNVCETTADQYEDDWYSRMPGSNPFNPLTANSRLQEFRGACFYYDRREARAADRGGVNPAHGRYGDGFRCARQDSLKRSQGL